MNIDELYQIYARYPKVITDSRKAWTHSIFFALKGELFDGNDFAAQALASGCNYAVVDRPELVTDNRYILVDNVLTALQELARMHRKKLDIPVIAITGTNGKTTTKELIKGVLGEKYAVYATSGNLNNHIGVPLTILAVPPRAQIAIIEMGANHTGEIRELCDIARPTCGLITNIGKAHLDGFGGSDGVRRAKKELYDYLNEHGGMIFYHEENPALAGMLEDAKAETIGYGREGKSECWGKTLSASPYLQVELHIDEESFRISTRMAGVYNLENLLAAACVGDQFTVPASSIADALSVYTPQNSRSQVFRTARNQLLLDYYNANPTSMSESLRNFFEHIQGPKMVILGDMFELGDEAPQEHAAIVDLLLPQNGVTRVVVGKHFYEAAKNAPGIIAFGETGELKSWLISNPPSGMFILVKGSRGMKLEQLTEFL
ncbi:MAG: UDP-N-acetylmuramoyl-tripeptide--D-alanyl-D-alanine ligase [Bacteroidales bacterium]|jgi:UDP-N-acetylmuramoyl-tripeptide--D-alanyl-D-alanine ligase|nr:UDP-N-acetylmuramoyl-tripeptide--D-alanyl-D-alanine ligase [Bacteroidales bacterium]